MPRRALLLALLPAAGLAFAPLAPASGRGEAYVLTRDSHQHAVLISTRVRKGASTSGSTSTWNPSPSATRIGTLRMALVEEAITAEDASELIAKARTIVEGDMGVKVAGMLAPDFRFLWQFNGELSRADYLAEGKGPYATLRTALPNLFWNAYDFRVDKYENNRVWATTRLSGTHTGPLVWDGKEYPASGARVEAAPECVSLVFDKESGLCTKMTGGFCLDRGVGNTGPAGAIWGVMQAIGEPVSAWKYFPPVKVLFDVVGPTFRPRKSLGTVASPFRDAVAIALAKQALSVSFEDPVALEGLLADDLQVYAPILGPLKKKAFLESRESLKGFYGGLNYDANFYDARVDPVEPSRVWITSRATVNVVGPMQAYGVKYEPKRQSYQAGPETLSVTFDGDGYISKITLGCPMDTELGETDGLTNFQGTLVGLGIPLPELFGRPVPESFRRLISSLTPQRLKAKPQAKKATEPVATSKKPSTLPSSASVASSKAAPAAKKATSKPIAKPVAPKVAPSVAKAAPAKPTSAKSTPAKTASAKSTPAKSTPAKTASAKSTPAKSTPAKTTSTKIAPIKTTARKSTPKAVTPAISAPKKVPAPATQGLFGSGSRDSKPAAPAAAANKKVTTKTVSSGQMERAAPAPAPAPKKSASQPKKQNVVPPAPQASSAPSKTVSVELSPKLLQQLEAAAGSAQAINQLSKRTELYAKGGISAMDYWGTLKKTLGPDDLQNLGPDIIGALPPGNQKKALFKIYSTGTT